MKKQENEHIKKELGNIFVQSSLSLKTQHDDNIKKIINTLKTLIDISKTNDELKVTMNKEKASIGLRFKIDSVLIFVIRTTDDLGIKPDCPGSLKYHNNTIYEKDQMLAILNIFSDTIKELISKEKFQNFTNALQNLGETTPANHNMRERMQILKHNNGGTGQVRQRPTLTKILGRQIA